jgi:hypothetical protein
MALKDVTVNQFAVYSSIRIFSSTAGHYTIRGTKKTKNLYHCANKEQKTTPRPRNLQQNMKNKNRPVKIASTCR